MTDQTGSTVLLADLSMLLTAIPPPSNVGLPLLKNASASLVGVVLGTTVGRWSGSPTSFSYQWMRCDGGGGSCVDIAERTGSHYTPTNADVGDTLRIRVVAHGSVGDSAPATSNPTPVVT
jgi:hypothetical protein